MTRVGRTISRRLSLLEQGSGGPWLGPQSQLGFELASGRERIPSRGQQGHEGGGEYGAGRNQTQERCLLSPGRCTQPSASLRVRIGLSVAGAQPVLLWVWQHAFIKNF